MDILLFALVKYIVDQYVTLQSLVNFTLQMSVVLHRERTGGGAEFIVKNKERKT